MYKVGDKFVILDVNKILHAQETGFENDVEYEVVKILEDGSPVLKHDANGRELYFYERELKYIKKVEKVMYKKGDMLLRTGGSNQFYKKGKEYEILEVVNRESVDSYIRIQQESSRGVMNVKDIPKNFELVKDDSVTPYETGDEIVFTDISNVEEASREILTVGKVYEVLKYSEGNDRHVEHFVVKGNDGKKFIVRYDEFKYVKKVSELESEMYIRVAPSNDKFNIGEKYEGAECGDYIIFNLNGEGRILSYTKSNVHNYFEKYYIDESERLREELEIKEKELEIKEKEIESLKATIRILQPLPVMDVNEERKVVIHRAKEFVREHFTSKPIKEHYSDMIYTASRRTVTVLLKQPGTSKVLLKGQSICAKGDVFNLYIGRAIALGRALGIDVRYFENAVQPEVAIGQIVKVKEGKWYERKVVEKAFNEEQSSLKYLKKMINDDKHSHIKIISDTAAQY